MAAHPDVGLRALVAVAARMRHPALSPFEVLGQLRRRYRMDEVAGLLGEQPDQIAVAYDGDAGRHC